MNTKEFSTQFDVLYNNITSNQAPGLNEYEKSVFLTKAQDEILKNYFNPKGNKYQEGYEDSRKRYIDFTNLISEYNSKEEQFGFNPKILNIDSLGGFVYSKLEVLRDWELKEDSENYYTVTPIKYGFGKVLNISSDGGTITI